MQLLLRTGARAFSAHPVPSLPERRGLYVDSLSAQTARGDGNSIRANVPAMSSGQRKRHGDDEHERSLSDYSAKKENAPSIIVGTEDAASEDKSCANLIETALSVSHHIALLNANNSTRTNSLGQQPSANNTTFPLPSRCKGGRH